jgi:DcmR-like sensory protein/GAF domain-containing protein
MTNGKERPGRFGARPPGSSLGRGPLTTNLASLFYEVLDAAIELAGADTGVIYRFDEERDCLTLITGHSLPERKLKPFSIVGRDSNTTSAAALTQRVRVAVDDVATSVILRGSAELGVMRELGIAATHSIPVVGASGRLWGVFTIHFSAPQRPDSYDPLMLNHIAFELADCLDRLAKQPGGMEQLRASAGPHKSFRLGGSVEQCPCHACAFFTSKEEEYRVMLPFMAEGLAAGDKLINIIDQRHRDERLAKLKDYGIDADAAEKSGQLELLPWEQAHIVGGHFNQHRMLADLDRQALGGGGQYSTTRFWSNQEWALQTIPGVEHIVEYEARFNYIWPKTSNVYVCVFDATKFRAGTMTQMMRTHPFVIIDGVMLKNEFYVPPEEYLKESRG